MYGNCHFNFKRSGSLAIALAAATAFCLSCVALERMVTLPAPKTDTPPVQPPVAGELRQMELATLEAVNRIRGQHSAGSLQERQALAEVAREHSRDMARRGYFNHESPEGNGAADRLRAHGLSYRKLGENIHQNRGYEDPVRAAVDSWMRSAPHKRILLDPAFRQTGVGIAVGEQGTYFFTQVFLTPPE